MCTWSEDAFPTFFIYFLGILSLHRFLWYKNGKQNIQNCKNNSNTKLHDILCFLNVLKWTINNQTQPLRFFFKLLTLQVNKSGKFYSPTMHFLRCCWASCHKMLIASENIHSPGEWNFKGWSDVQLGNSTGNTRNICSK